MNRRKMSIFFRYEHADNKIICLYYPVPSRFQQAVQSGELVGSVKKQLGSVAINLTATSEVIEAFLAKAGAEECFAREPSLTLTLVKRYE